MCGRVDRVPHTHEPIIRIDHDGDIIVRYGDQKMHFVYRYFPGWRSRVNRVLRRQIRRHDRWSRKAMNKVDVVATVHEKNPLSEQSGQWGTEVLKQKVRL